MKEGTQCSYTWALYSGTGTSSCTISGFTATMNDTTIIGTGISTNGASLSQIYCFATVTIQNVRYKDTSGITTYYKDSLTFRPFVVWNILPPNDCIYESAADYTQSPTGYNTFATSKLVKYSDSQ